MAGETLITVVGNLTADPELRFTPSGAAVASFTIASTPRTYDRNTNEWKDGEALFLRCSIWRQAAENVAESLKYAAAKVNKTQRGSSGGGGFSGGSGGGSGPSDDPWGSAPPSSPGGDSGGFSDEPPF